MADHVLMMLFSESVNIGAGEWTQCPKDTGSALPAVMTHRCDGYSHSILPLSHPPFLVQKHGNPLQYSCLENPHGQRSLAGSSPWGHKESDMTEAT